MYQPINGFTKRKILDIINARPQEGAAMHIHGGCTYLAKDGAKCAVGLFIPDGHPAQLDGDLADRTLRTFPDLEKFMPLEVSALMYLQAAHDAENTRIGEMPFKGNAKAAMLAWVEKNVAA